MSPRALASAQGDVPQEWRLRRYKADAGLGSVGHPESPSFYPNTSPPIRKPLVVVVNPYHVEETQATGTGQFQVETRRLDKEYRS